LKPFQERKVIFQVYKRQWASKLSQRNN
jgi:hypothetical protein